MFLAFWSARRAEVASARPNAGHLALADLQAARPATVHVTQNVDGLLAMAGCREVLELHGNLGRSRCDACRRGFEEQKPAPQRCEDCGGHLRPDLVLFGEPLPAQIAAEAERASKRSDVFLRVGTSALVHPAAGLPLRATSRGAKLVVLDMAPNPLDGEADGVLRGASEQILTAVLAALRRG